MLEHKTGEFVTRNQIVERDSTKKQLTRTVEIQNILPYLQELRGRAFAILELRLLKFHISEGRS